MSLVGEIRTTSISSSFAKMLLNVWPYRIKFARLKLKISVALSSLFSILYSLYWHDSDYDKLSLLDG